MQLYCIHSFLKGGEERQEKRSKTNFRREKLHDNSKLEENLNSRDLKAQWDGMCKKNKPAKN